MKLCMHVDDELNAIDDYFNSLENNLRLKMEGNWKLMHTIEETRMERDFYYNLLRRIEVKDSV
jgi:hypothetical protein